jgi:hypothetical protein
LINADGENEKFISIIDLSIHLLTYILLYLPCLAHYLPMSIYMFIHVTIIIIIIIIIRIIIIIIIIGMIRITIIIKGIFADIIVAERRRARLGEEGPLPSKNRWFDLRPSHCIKWKRTRINLP